MTKVRRKTIEASAEWVAQLLGEENAFVYAVKFDPSRLIVSFYITGDELEEVPECMETPTVFEGIDRTSNMK